MIPAAAGVATGAAEDTAPKQEQSLSEEILSLMRGQEPEPPGEQEVHEEIPAPTPEEVPKEEEAEPEEEQELPVAAKGDWPDSAKKRLAEEADKRRRAQSRADQAENERDQWRNRADQLSQALEEANLPRPTREDPLADVFDNVGLQKARGHYQNIKEVATQALDENPTSDEIEIAVGKDKDGQPVNETFTRKTLSGMKNKAEYALQTLIPQRAQILAARGQADALALQIYPQFGDNNGENEWAGFVRQVIGAFPALAKVPDIAVWLGHALEGRRVTVERLKKDAGKNGAEENTVARRILSTPRIKAAPPVSTGRVPSATIPRRGADVEAARKAMIARPGDDDAMEAFIDAKLFRGASRGYEKVS